jgi:thiol:disulfide interchange protein DsbC
MPTFPKISPIAMLASRVTRMSTGVVGGIGMLVAAAIASASSPSNQVVLAALKERLPKTALANVDCTVIDGICEVTSGKSIFYVDKKARYLIVGHVFDMETRQDLTSARLLETNAEALLGGASQRGDGGEAGGEDVLASAQAGRVVARDYPMPKPSPGAGATRQQFVALSSLPTSGAIHWGSGGAKVTVFTDFRCGYCRALTNQLETMNVQVTERPISVLGTRELSNRVYCAKDRVRALHAAYAGDIPPEARCDTSGLDANERFARDNGFTGTPVIVRSDGAVHHGYLPKDQLLAWLKGVKS